MKFGVLGPNGRLGQQLVFMGGEPLPVDITNPDIEFPKLDVIINCAAYTDVDGCEMNEGYARASDVNYVAVGNVYKAVLRSGAHLVHISSDYVFGGNHGPYSELSRFPEEDDPPTNLYGLTKLCGEASLLDGVRATIVRTTGLYGGISGRPDFLKTVLKAIDSGDPFFATNELYGNQTYVPHLAQGLLTLSGIMYRSKTFPKLMHIASQDVCSRFEFARMIATEWGYSTYHINPCKNDEVPGWVARRPTRGGLLTRTASNHGIPIYTIADGLREAHENWDRNTSV